MAYIPDILDYKPFYIQTDADAVAVSTTEWGLIAKTNPFPILPTPKEPYKNEWLDEDGDDEYAVLHYEAFEFSVNFYVKCFSDGANTAESVLVSQIRSFFDKIKSGEFKVYDSYTGLGWQKVRYAGYNEDDFTKGSNWARAIFSITFKVNDPISRLSLSGGKIV